MATEVPVFMFVGFLDSGKTTFIQSILENEEFSNGVSTLLVLCEEGEEEYRPERFAKGKVTFYKVENEEDLEPFPLEKAFKEAKAERVIVEYNGMWQLSSFIYAMPEQWIIAQEMTFADAGTFQAFNKNMRNLIVDQIQNTDCVTFRNVDADPEKQKELHDICRGIQRGVDIVYKYNDGTEKVDDVPDPLPYDLDARVVEIGDDAYGLWYAEMMQFPDKYDKKTYRFKAFVGKDRSLGKDEFFAGRHVMSCCVNDIQFAGMLAVWDKAQILKTQDWVIIEAKLSMEKNRVYRTVGPVLRVTGLVRTSEPEHKVVTLAGTYADV